MNLLSKLLLPRISVLLLKETVKVGVWAVSLGVMGRKVFPQLNQS